MIFLILVAWFFCPTIEVDYIVEMSFFSDWVCSIENFLNKKTVEVEHSAQKWEPAWVNTIICSGQIVATSHDLRPPKVAGFREISLFHGNLGWWNKIPFGKICLEYVSYPSELTKLSKFHFDDKDTLSFHHYSHCEKSIFGARLRLHRCWPDKEKVNFLGTIYTPGSWHILGRGIFEDDFPISMLVPWRVSRWSKDGQEIHSSHFFHFLPPFSSKILSNLHQNPPPPCHPFPQEIKP